MDFLDRLVERQRNPLNGVCPALPSRFEPVADAFVEVQELAVSERLADERPPADAAQVMERPVVESRVEAAPEPEWALRDRPAEDPARPQSPARVAAPEVTVPTVRETRRNGEPPRDERRSVQPPARPEPPPPTLSPIERPARIPEESRRAVALRPPMLPAPPPSPPDPGTGPDVAERSDPGSSRSTMVSISIGRIEIRPPEPARGESRMRLEAPVTPPRPAYRPRLSLESYLERPNRGRS